MGRIAKVTDVDDPDEDTDDSDDLGEQVAKVVDLLLEGSLLADLGGDGLVDVSDGGEGSSVGDNRLGSSIDDGRSLRSESAPVALVVEGEDSQRRAC